MSNKLLDRLEMTDMPSSMFRLVFMYANHARDDSAYLSLDTIAARMRKRRDYVVQLRKAAVLAGFLQPTGETVGDCPVYRVNLPPVKELEAEVATIKSGLWKERQENKRSRTRKLRDGKNPPGTGGEQPSRESARTGWFLPHRPGWVLHCQAGGVMPCLPGCLQPSLTVNRTPTTERGGARGAGTPTPSAEDTSTLTRDGCPVEGAPPAAKAKEKIKANAETTMKPRDNILTHGNRKPKPDYLVIATDLIGYLNGTYGSNFRPDDAACVDPIIDRLREGATEELCRDVIDAKMTGTTEPRHPSFTFSEIDFPQAVASLKAASKLADKTIQRKMPPPPRTISMAEFFALPEAVIDQTARAVSEPLRDQNESMREYGLRVYGPAKAKRKLPSRGIDKNAAA